MAVHSHNIVHVETACHGTSYQETIYDRGDDSGLRGGVEIAGEGRETKAWSESEKDVE